MTTTPTRLPAQGYNFTVIDKLYDTTPRARKREPGDCSSKAPCGELCCLDSHVRHQFHACANERCGQCHGDRFRMRSEA